MRRRDFLLQTASTLPTVRVARSVSLARVGISTWSFHDFFPKSLNLLDYPEMLADRYHVHRMEMVAPHFESMRPSYLKEINRRLSRSRSQVVNIPVDIPELAEGGGLSDTYPAIRNRAVMASQKWIDVAQAVGAKSVRCDPGKVNRQDFAPTIQSYKELASYGKSKGVYVLIENHNGVGSEHPKDLIKIFRAVGDDCGALPDFGNFPNERVRRQGLKMLFPYSRTVCHAKGLALSASGKETAYNFQQAMETVSASFQGTYSIEYEGKDDPYKGVGMVVRELVGVAL
jgi:hypothetical protein